MSKPWVSLVIPDEKWISITKLTLREFLTQVKDGLQATGSDCVSCQPAKLTLINTFLPL